MTTPLYSLDEISQTQTAKHTTHNEALRKLEAVLGRALSRTTDAEPGSPSNGDVYIITGSASGTNWTAFSQYDIAYYGNGAWSAITPVDGMSIPVADENIRYYFDGATWVNEPLTSLGLTASELTQLQNINAVTISNAQWAYVGSLDQGLATTSAPTFVTINTGQGAVECYAMNQPVRTTDVISGGNATADAHLLNRVTADARYGQLGSANSWTGDQDVTGAVTATTGVTVASGQTSLANYLEGTYTATLTCSTSGTVTLNSSFDTLSYTRIGNIVNIRGYIEVSSVSSPLGDLRLNIPIVSANPVELAGRSVGQITVAGSVSKNVDSFGAFIDEGVSYVSLTIIDGAAISFLGAPEMQASASIMVNFNYQV